MTTFNYRVVIRNGEYAVHEVYYDDSGTPEACTENPFSPVTPSLEDLRYELTLLGEALEQPALKYEDIGGDATRDGKGRR
jgi:hypothetical protein